MVLCKIEDMEYFFLVLGYCLCFEIRLNWINFLRGKKFELLIFFNVEKMMWCCNVVMKFILLIW